MDIAYSVFSNLNYELLPDLVAYRNTEESRKERSTQIAESLCRHPSEPVQQICLLSKRPKRLQSFQLEKGILYMLVQGSKAKFKLIQLESDKGIFWFPSLHEVDFEDKEIASRKKSIVACLKNFVLGYFSQFMTEYPAVMTIPKTQIPYDEVYFLRVVNMLKAAVVISTIEKINQDLVGSRDEDLVYLFNPPSDLKIKVFPESIKQNVETTLEFDVGIKASEVEMDRQRVIRQDVLGEYDLETITLTFTNMFKISPMTEISPGLELAEFCAHQDVNFGSALEKMPKTKITVHQATNGEMTRLIKEAYSQSLLSVVFVRLVSTLTKPHKLRFFKVQNISLSETPVHNVPEDLARQMERFISPMKFEMLSSNQASCCFITLGLDEQHVLHLSTHKEAVVLRVFDQNLEEISVRMTIRQEMARMLLSKDCSLPDVTQRLANKGIIDWEPSIHH